MKRLFVLLLSVALAACQDAPEPLHPNPTPNPLLSQQAPGHASAPDRLALARSVPGFGGIFLDENGVPTVHLTDPAQRGSAERALKGFMRQRGFAPSQLQVRRGAFDYRTLDHWFNRAWPEAFGVPGIVFADLSETRNRLVFGVHDAAAVHGVQAVVARLGIPEEAVVVEVTEPIRPLATLQERASSIVGGVQIHFGNYLCTLGFNALSGSQESFITNSHCTNTQGGTEGTQYYQPTSTVDPTVIGTEVDDPEYFRGGECPRSYKCRYSDASRARRESARTFARGEIARPEGLGSLNVVGSFTITGEYAQSAIGQNCPVEGIVLHKVGRTTGWSAGKITDSCVHVGVFGSNKAQLYQVMVQASVGSGDSGSPVFSRSGSNYDVTLYGILWGGSSSSFVYSPMVNVEHELGSLTVTAGGEITDETAPAAPTGLAATAVSSSRIDLDWADNTESDVDRYEVHRSETSGGSYTLIGSPTASGYSDTGLSASTTYYYVVRAVDTSGNTSGNSNEANATTQEPSTGTMHVESLTGNRNVKGKSGKWEAFVTALIHDESSNPVANATVSVTWTSDGDPAGGNAAGTTGSDGTVTLSTGNIAGGTQVTFTVESVTHGSLTYDPGANKESSIIVHR